MSSDGRLRINLLGQPEVWLDGVQLTNFSTTKTEALLYYLAATGLAHSRESLAGLLWSEMPEAKARRNLTKSLTVLRRLLAPFLLIEPQRVGLDPKASFMLDVTQLATAVSTPDLTANAIALYRSDFLEGFFVKDALAFEAWQLTQREQLREMAVDALERLGKESAAQKAYAVGITYGRRLLELDPWRESAHRQLMLLLARQGQPVAALAQYEQCRQVLADELGVEPMPETIALARRIRLARQEQPYQLPASATPFVGRTEELAQIGRLLADPGCRLLTLVGLGGMGKTRLALAAARQANQEQAWQFLHGILFVSLTTVASPDLLPVTMADALDLVLDGRQDPVDQLNHFLRDKEILLVLDNFEQLLPAQARLTSGPTDVLTRLLQACPDIKFLITSRELLRLEAEHRFDVAGLPFPADSDQLSVISYQLVEHQSLVRQWLHSDITNYPAVQLFMQAARQVRPQFEMTPENAADIIQICRALDGIPLAIKLAASWLRVLTSAEVAAELERGLDLLATTMRDVPPRQRSMTAVFDHSWAMLTAVEQKCLAALAVFQGGFTGQAAQEIAAASLPTLAGLADRTLLHVRQTEAGTRYHLHELTRQYAAEKLAQSPETAAVMRMAHTHYYARRLAALTPELSGKTPYQAHAAIHREIGNARQAWQQAIDRLDLVNLNRLMEPLTAFYDRQGWITEGQVRLAAAVTAIQAADDENKTAVRLLGGLLARRGMLIGRIGQFAEGEAALRQSLEQARQAADPHLLAFALLEMGALLRDQSRFAEAANSFQESRDIAMELNEPSLIARATEKLGIITWDQGSHAAAQARLAEALALFQELQDTRRIAATLNSLGNVVMSTGDYQTALTHYEEALPMVRELADWLLLDTVLINLGMVNNELGDFDQSRRYYEESLAISRRIGDEVGVAYCLTGLGQVSLVAGNLGQARDLLGQSLALNREMGRERYVSINLNLLGDVALQGEDWLTAQALYEEGLAVSERIDHPWGVASSHLRLGDLAVAQGDESVASQHYLTALSLGQEMEAQVFVLTALTNLAGQLLKRGEAATAVSVLHIVQNQPTISDSLRQTVADLLAKKTAVLAPQQLGELDTAVALVHTTFQVQSKQSKNEA